MLRSIKIVLLAGTGLGLNVNAVAQPWSPQPFTPVPNVIKPFGYGQVSQFLSSASGATGNAICTAHSPLLKCFEVSQNGSCQASVPAGKLVSCGISANPPVDETNFQPVNCNGYANGDGGKSGLLGPADWCLTMNFMPTRKQNTIYQFDDYVRLGVNVFFGGTIFEVYGTDKVDRILQNGGGATQLSLWAFSPEYANKNYARGYYAVPPPNTQQCNTQSYSTQASCSNANNGAQCIEGVAGPNLTNCPTIYPCSDNAAAAGVSINPLQAASLNCQWDAQNGAVDSVTAPAPGQVTVTKANPANYTRSDSYGVTWSQTSQVVGPYAMITYKITAPTMVPDTDFQEIPAIFLHNGLGANLYYYAGNSPYADPAGQVSFVNALNGPNVGTLQLPNRQGPFGTGANVTLTEDWVSSCDSTGKICLTVATFSSASQDYIENWKSDGSYIGVHGFFSITQGQTRTITTFLFPYRFDDVVMGMSVRQWIYQLHQNPLYSE